MKVPKTDKIIKSELVNIGVEVYEGEFPKTVSFRPTAKSYYHLDELKKDLLSKFGVEFSNTDVMEFALAFAYENFTKSEEDKK